MRTALGVATFTLKSVGTQGRLLLNAVVCKPAPKCGSRGEQAAVAQQRERGLWGRLPGPRLYPSWRVTQPGFPPEAELFVSAAAHSLRGAR